MPSHKSIYRVLASLVILSFVFIAPFGTANATGTRSIPESRIDPVVSASGLLDLPESVPPDPPVTDGNIIFGSGGGQISLDSLDPSQPIPLSLEEKLRFQEQVEDGLTEPVEPEEQLPPVLEDDRLSLEELEARSVSWLDSLPPAPQEGLPDQQIHVEQIEPTAAPEIANPEFLNAGGVLYDSDGNPKAGIIIRAEAVDRDFFTETVTDSSGRFHFLNLPAGDYRLLARSMDGTFLPLQETESVNVYSLEALAPQAHELTLLEEITLGPNYQTGLPFQPPALKGEALPAETLQGTGVITGTVTKTGGTPLMNVYVAVWTQEYYWVSETYTDETGFYSIGGLETGSYIVYFYCDEYCDPSFLMEEYYNNKSVYETADLVPVTDGATTSGIDAVLNESGSISGQVTSLLDDTPMEYVEIDVTNLAGTFFTYGYTDYEGNYTIDVLPPDSYTVYFYPFNGFIPEYYDNRASIGEADPVTVVEGQNTTGINAQLGPGQLIRGRVTSEADGTPVYTQVAAVPISGYYNYYAWTNPDGIYSFYGMEPGYYRIQFTPQSVCDEFGCQPTEYLPEYYDGKTEYYLGDVLAVTADSIHNNIDATLLKGASISGNVKASDGVTPLTGVNIYLYPDGGSSFWAGETDLNGNYRTNLINPGTYKVGFDTSSCGSLCGYHMNEYYNNALTLEAATPVVVSAQTTVSGIDAVLALGGSISGRVTDAATSNPMVGVAVTVQDDPVYRTVYTDSNGDYEAAGLMNGNYTVWFYSPAPYVSEYYNNKYSYSAADEVPVTPPEKVTGIDAALSVGGGISGVVTDESSGVFLSNVVVTATSDAYYSYTWTDSSGAYMFSNLPAGSYKVQFYASDGIHQSEYYNNKPDSASADPVVVTSSNTTGGIDAALSTGGEISGTVTSLAGGAPLEQVGVILMDSDKWWIGNQKTDSQGKFHFTGLNSGTYYIYFDTDLDCTGGGCASSGYVSEYYNDKATLTEADPISVTIGQVTSGIDATLAAGGEIAGIMTGETGACPQYSSYAYLYNTNQTVVASTNPDSVGNYHFGGLQPGIYKLYFTCQGFLSEWYNNKNNFEEATPVSAIAGEITSGINVVLAAAGGISGVVTSETSGLGLSNVFVSVTNGVTSYGVWTNSVGEYTILSLPAGAYKVQFTSYNQSYISEFYNNKSNSAEADSVTVTPPAVTGNINAALAVGGSISGTVTAEDTGLPLENIAVLIENDTFYRYGYTDADGHYTIAGIPGGTYWVAFYTWNNSAYVYEYYNNQRSQGYANWITITPPAALTGIDAALAKGASISGTVVSDEDDLPLADVWVEMRLTTGDSWGAYTDSEGNFSVSGLRAGTYRLRFVPAGSDDSRTRDYMQEYYKDAIYENDATLITLAVGQNATGYNASLAIGAKITGQVTAADGGQPISNIWVEAYILTESGRRNYQMDTHTDAAGNYTLYGLPGGDYYVYFRPDATTDFIAESYNNKVYWQEGDLVTVPERTTVSNINASLETGRHIQGTVTSAASGMPISQWFWISIYDEDGRWREYAYNNGGETLSPALPPGNYKLYFNPHGNTSNGAAAWVNEYYNDRPTLLTGIPITVGSDSNTVVDNVALDLAGQISGRVTAQSSGLGIGNLRVEYLNLDYRWYYYPSGNYVFTNTDGTYTIPYLEPGNYQVCFYPSDDLIRECISEVEVTIGGHVENVDAALEIGGRISGRITADGTLVPLADVYVDIYNPDGSYADGAVTSMTGDYISSSLPPGEYRLGISPSRYGASKAYKPEYYDDQTSYESAVPVFITAGQTTSNIDASLALGGKITGRVTSAATGDPVPDNPVVVYSASDNYDYWYYNYTYTDMDGNYAVEGLPSNNYKVLFYGSDFQNLMEEYYTNQRTFDAANLVYVGEAETVSGIDAALEKGGQITGRVTQAGTGLPLSGAQVSTHTPDGPYHYAVTDSEGYFSLNGLPTGSYELTGSNYLYANSVYGGFDTPILVPVTEGAVTPGINLELVRGAVIAGWVTGSDTGKHEWSWVRAYDTSGNEVYRTEAVNPKGYYEMILAPGQEYRISFSPNYSDQPYVTTYYANKSSLALADPIPLAAGEIKYPINGTMALGGQISGRVTDESAQPLQDVVVVIYDALDQIVSASLTDGEGNFFSSALISGNYRIYFDPIGYGSLNGYLPEYYNNKDSLALADLVPVVTGEITGGINAQLALVKASFSSTAQLVSEAAGSVSITLSLNVPSDLDITVPFAVTGYAAGGGVDHTLANGAFQFAAGETIDTITFDVTDDTIDELDETIIVTLGEPSNAQLGANQVHTVTILDNDLPIIVLPAPVVTQVTPSQGWSQVPANVVITGSSFNSGAVATLKLDALLVPLATTWVSETQLAAVIPAGLEPGVYDVEVGNPDGKSGSLPDAYQVMPPLTDDLFANTYDLWADPAAIYAGESVTLGLVVQRQGGQESLPMIPVDFYLGDPGAGGIKIGSDSVNNLDPAQWKSTGGFTWTAPAAGNYTLYAVIDPADIISETVETNNVISRQITVLAAPEEDADLIPPTLASFVVNDGNPDTGSIDVQLTVSAVDNFGGSGVHSIMVIEYDFFQSINQWAQVKTSGWLPYTMPFTPVFQLMDTPGAKYLQVWAADAAGNISLEPLTAFINYIPATDSLAKGQSRYYVYPLAMAEEFSAVVTPQWGDPDLYIWPPDFVSRNPWMSLASEGPDSVALISPLAGMYVVQIYGFSNTSFQYSTGTGSISGLHTLSLSGELQVAKEPVSEPGLEPGNEPSGQRGIPEAPQGSGEPPQYYYVFLPTIKK